MKVTIPQPCHEDWNAMTAVEKGRHCAVCDKVVKDFSRMAEKEIMEVIASTEEKICGRVHINQLQPAGFTQQVSFRWKKWVWGNFLVPMLAYFSLQASTSKAEAQHLRGDIAIPENNALQSAKQEAHTLFIKVRHTGSSTPVPNATVTISASGKLLATLTTDEQGVARYNVEKNTSRDNGLDVKVSTDYTLPREYRNIRMNRRETTLMVYLEDDLQIMMLGEIVPYNKDAYGYGQVDSIPGTLPEVTEKPPVETVTEIFSPDIDSFHIVPEDPSFLPTYPKTRDSVSEKYGFTLFPNPGNGVFTVTAARIPEEGMYQVFDMKGNRLLTGEVREHTFSVNMEHYGAGIYLMTILQKGVAIETKKIVISR